MTNAYKYGDASIELIGITPSGVRHSLIATVRHNALHLHVHGEIVSSRGYVELRLLPAEAHRLCTFITQNVTTSTKV